MAELTRRPIQNLVIQAIDQNLPPLPADLSPEIHQELSVLESMSDDELWQVARSKVDSSDYRRYSELLDQERSTELTPEDAATLEELYHRFNVAMLRKAYAAVLLEWRGYALPFPLDLNASDSWHPMSP